MHPQLSHTYKIGPQTGSSCPETLQCGWIKAILRRRDGQNSAKIEDQFSDFSPQIYPNKTQNISWKKNVFKSNSSNSSFKKYKKTFHTNWYYRITWAIWSLGWILWPVVEVIILCICLKFSKLGVYFICSFISWWSRLWFYIKQYYISYKIKFASLGPGLLCHGFVYSKNETLKLLI